MLFKFSEAFGLTQINDDADYFEIDFDKFPKSWIIWTEIGLLRVHISQAEKKVRVYKPHYFLEQYLVRRIKLFGTKHLEQIHKHLTLIQHEDSEKGLAFQYAVCLELKNPQSKLHQLICDEFKQHNIHPNPRLSILELYPCLFSKHAKIPSHKPKIDEIAMSTDTPTASDYDAVMNYFQENKNQPMKCSFEIKRKLSKNANLKKDLVKNFFHGDDSVKLRVAFSFTEIPNISKDIPKKNLKFDELMKEFSENPRKRKRGELEDEKEGKKEEDEENEASEEDEESEGNEEQKANESVPSSGAIRKKPISWKKWLDDILSTNCALLIHGADKFQDCKFPFELFQKDPKLTVPKMFKAFLKLEYLRDYIIWNSEEWEAEMLEDSLNFPSFLYYLNINSILKLKYCILKFSNSHNN